MRNLILFFILILTQTLLGQDFTYKLNSEDCKCEIMFPAEPNMQQKDFADYTTILQIATLNEKVYLFSHTYIPTEAGVENELLQATKKGFLNSIGMIPNSEKNIKKGKAKGLYTNGVSTENNLYVSYQVFYINERLYQIAIMQANELPNKKLVKRFFNGLKFL